jgi:hypothetical protein
MVAILLTLEEDLECPQAVKGARALYVRDPLVGTLLRAVAVFDGLAITVIDGPRP